MIQFGNTNNRQYQCFVCGVVFKTYPEMKDHVFEVHEEGREYLKCPVKHCGCPVRDLRFHFRTKHPACKCPANGQMRATIMYDVKSPNKRKKVPSFKEGYHASTKMNREMHYRSGYELEVYKCLDAMGDVYAYEVEPLSIPYSMRGKQRQYFPDLRVVFTDGSIEIWEIKPSNQTVLEQNSAKFKAARHYCQLRGWGFDVITEQRIEQLKKRST